MTLLRVLDLLGVFVFALSGATLGVARRMDLFGVLVLGIVAATGGGLLRDVLLGDLPPVALVEANYLLVSTCAGLLVFVASPLVERLTGAVRLFDAAGLGLFVATGTSKALDAGLGTVGALTLGCLTGIGGGVLRDLLAREVPVVLQRELYAVPALLGAAVVVVGDGLAAGASRWPSSPRRSCSPCGWSATGGAGRRQWRRCGTSRAARGGQLAGEEGGGPGLRTRPVEPVARRQHRAEQQRLGQVGAGLAGPAPPPPRSASATASTLCESIAGAGGDARRSLPSSAAATWPDQAPTIQRACSSSSGKYGPCRANWPTTPKPGRSGAACAGAAAGRVRAPPTPPAAGKGCRAS